MEGARSAGPHRTLSKVAHVPRQRLTELQFFWCAQASTFSAAHFTGFCEAFLFQKTPAPNLRLSTHGAAGSRKRFPSKLFSELPTTAGFRIFTLVPRTCTDTWSSAISACSWRHRQSTSAAQGPSSHRGLHTESMGARRGSEGRRDHAARASVRDCQAPDV